MPDADEARIDRPPYFSLLDGDPVALDYHWLAIGMRMLPGGGARGIDRLPLLGRSEREALAELASWLRYMDYAVTTGVELDDDTRIDLVAEGSADARIFVIKPAGYDPRTADEDIRLASYRYRDIQPPNRQATENPDRS
ncbi:hypothetical protein ACFQNE_06215 [Gordonia phosphorivorans]|uniref:Oxidoreductase n=1 Tax=Gordonia phosphorivorans TaxID=1056982 RepID=A0ABV6H4U2_9ACTN